jgi:hypothetical protein
MCKNVVQALRSQQNDTSTSIKEEVVHVASKEAASAPRQDSGHEAANVESLTTNVDMMEIHG